MSVAPACHHARPLARLLVALAALTVALLLPALGSTTTSASPAEASTACDGVTVRVERSGSTKDRCAPGSPQNGLYALRDAGFVYTEVPGQGGMVCTIDGHPEACNGAPVDAYWSYWHAEAGAKAWTYANRGAGNRTPTKGSHEAWVFGAGDPPSSPPPAAPSPSPSPSPTETTPPKDGGSSGGSGSGGSGSGGSGSSGSGSSGSGSSGSGSSGSGSGSTGTGSTGTGGSGSGGSGASGSSGGGSSPEAATRSTSGDEGGADRSADGTTTSDEADPDTSSDEAGDADVDDRAEPTDADDTADETDETNEADTGDDPADDPEDTDTDGAVASATTDDTVTVEAPSGGRPGVGALAGGALVLGVAAAGAFQVRRRRGELGPDA